MGSQTQIKKLEGIRASKQHLFPVMIEIYLCHFRLGHPNFFYLHNFFPKLFQNKEPSLFQCEICAFAKHHRSTYTPIYSDIWGPSRIKTCKDKRWFITLIDDRTRVC